MSIRDVIKHIDSMTETYVFDKGTVNYIQSLHPNLTNSDRKELKRHISKYTEFGYLVTLNTIKAFAIWDPDEAILEARKKGVFRYKVWKESNYARDIISDLIENAHLFNFSVQSLSFLQNKLKLAWLYDYYQNEERRIIKILKKLHKDRKILKSISDISVEESLIKDLLVYVDNLFFSGHTTVHGRYDDLSGFTLEEITDSVSYLVFLLYNNIKWKVNCAYFANIKTIESYELRKVVLLCCKLCQVNEWEVLIDFFDYDVDNLENNHYVIKAKDPDFEKSYRLAYIEQTSQVYFVQQKTINQGIGKSIKDACDLYVSKHTQKELLKRISQNGITRIRFAIDSSVFSIINSLDDQHYYFEEILTIRSLSHEYISNEEELLNISVTEHCKLIDVIKLQRIFIYLCYFTTDYLYPNESKEIILNSLVPAFSEKNLYNIFNGVFKDSIKTNELIRLFTAPFERKIDLQYTPLVLLNGDYHIPMSLAAKSNLLRNCIAISRTSGNQESNSMSEPMVKECAQIFKECTLHPTVLTNVKVKYNQRNGEIDVLVVTENYIFIIECKCPLCPVNNFEMRGDNDHLHKAIKQLDLCKQAFENQEYQKSLLKQRKIPYKPRQILTCIVFGNRIFNGLSFSGHPVRFINELNNFMINGTIRTDKKVYSIWSGAELAEQDIISYLSENTAITRTRFDAMIKILEQLKLGKMKLSLESYGIAQETVDYQLDNRFNAQNV